jgi:hypothetical protein
MTRPMTRTIFRLKMKSQQSKKRRTNQNSLELQL